MNWDNADLGIVALLLIAVACVVTGHTEQGLLSTIVAGIAGIASRKNGNGNK